MEWDDYTLADFIEFNDENLFKKAELLQQYILNSKKKKYFTYFRPVLSRCGPRVKMFDYYANREREMIMMASNNYLGLSYRPEVIEAGKKALEKYGCALGGSPLLCGYSDLHQMLEEELADFKGSESALIFPTGFTTNMGTITALMRKNDIIISDRLDHASIIDGCLFSGAKFRSFPHNNVKKMEKLLKKYADVPCGKLVIVEGIYSMDGDMARIDEIHRLSKQYNARLLVDEAHATGIIGKSGAGTIEHFGLKGQVDIVVGTFSKTLGAMGGFVCARKDVIDYIRFYARPYLFSASLSPVVIACVLEALRILKAEPELIKKLWDNINYMKENLIKAGFNLGETESAILPVLVGKDVVLRKIATALHEKGIYANSVFFPAVPKDSARIRLSLTVDHTREDMDTTLTILEEIGKKFGVIE